MCVLKKSNPVTCGLIDFPVSESLYVDLKNVFHTFEYLTLSKNVTSSYFLIISVSQQNYDILLRLCTHLLLPDALCSTQLWEIPLSLVAKSL